MSQLILIPGLASDAVMWQHQTDAFGPSHQPQVTTVLSQHDAIEAMAQALLDTYPGDLLLCGASMGGIVAMEVARLAPQRILGLALLGTSARPESDDVRALREAAISFFEDGRAAEVLRANVPLAFHSSRIADAKLVQTYLDFVLRAGEQQLIRQNRAIMARPDARLHLRTLTCPALVMCGDSDQLTPPECSREIAALLPNAELVLVPQCGHMLTMERPQHVNAALAQWLARVKPAP